MTKIARTETKSPPSQHGQTRWPPQETTSPTLKITSPHLLKTTSWPLKTTIPLALLKTTRRAALPRCQTSDYRPTCPWPRSPAPPAIMTRSLLIRRRRRRGTTTSMIVWSATWKRYQKRWEETIIYLNITFAYFNCTELLHICNKIYFSRSELMSLWLFQVGARLQHLGLEGSFQITTIIDQGRVVFKREDQGTESKLQQSKNKTRRLLGLIALQDPHCVWLQGTKLLVCKIALTSCFN